MPFPSLLPSAFLRLLPLLCGVGGDCAMAPATGLASARARFAAGDLDRSGGLGPGEVEALGLSTLQALRFDREGDGELALDEYLVGERRRAADQNLRVERRLEAEVTRILLRRAIERRRAARCVPLARAVGRGPAAERLRMLRDAHRSRRWREAEASSATTY